MRTMLPMECDAGIGNVAKPVALTDVQVAFGAIISHFLQTFSDCFSKQAKPKKTLSPKQATGVNNKQQSLRRSNAKTKKQCSNQNQLKGT